MDYKKKYEGLMKNLEHLYESVNPEWKQTIECYIPEFKNSKDDEVREHLLKHFHNKTKEEWNGMPTKNIIAWLENQDPKKHEEELERAYKCADEVQYRKGYEAAKREFEKQGKQKVAKFMTKSYITPNPEFFQWIYNRLVYQYHENPNMDYMRSLKDRIEDMQEIVDVKADNILAKQNPTWSEEDENMLQQALSTIRYALSIPADKEDDPCFAGSSTIAWLKSLKEGMKGE